MNFIKILIATFMSCFFLLAQAKPTTATERTTAYFNSIRNNPLEVLMFVSAMPKGAELHDHMTGATYAENLISYGKNDNLCIAADSFALLQNVKCSRRNQVKYISEYPEVYNDLIDAWSMRNFHPGKQTMNQHFFSAFAYFLPIKTYYPIADKHRGDILAEITSRAAAEHVDYLELIDAPLLNSVTQLTANIHWNGNFAAMEQAIQKNGLASLVKKIEENTRQFEAYKNKKLHCGTSNAEPGCQVVTRYQYYAFREEKPLLVFAQLLVAFELAKNDPAYVGVNIVGPEDGYIALHDYKLHMQMFAFLHKQYPNVKLSLHAGELQPTMTTPINLSFHVNDAVNIAHANRIGHAVDVAEEKNASSLLHEMAKKHILVEVNLTSNADLLRVKGLDQPLPVFLRYHVPVALSTDDAGVLRTNLNHEYQRAVITYHLSYLTLKRMDRNSLTYSFLPGKSLWSDAYNAVPVKACSEQTLGASQPSGSCKQFLKKNFKAKMQWHLEEQFQHFERQVG